MGESTEVNAASSGHLSGPAETPNWRMIYRGSLVAGGRVLPLLIRRDRDRWSDLHQVICARRASREVTFPAQGLANAGTEVGGELANPNRTAHQVPDRERAGQLPVPNPVER